MQGIKIITRSERLRQRRKNIDETLRHLENERRQVEQNTQWMDRMAYQSRLSLLDRLTRWYHEEMGQIDQVLGGASKTRYRICADCHEPIDARRLELDRHARLCTECKEFRTSLRSRKFPKPF
jgi:RNA polymerase-binding transcription factor DksA